MLREGPVARAVRASCSLPVFFPPVEWRGRLLVDGGVSSQLPVLAARELLTAGVVVGVDVNTGAAAAALLTHMGQVGLQFVSLFAMTNALRERAYADVMIDVDATGISLLDLGKAELMLERGRQAAKSKLGEIEAAIGRVAGTDPSQRGNP
jgi:NTE family protein